MIAAVSVVFPWSTCPIVPTFTCGFVRSNLALAMCLDPDVRLSAVVEQASESASLALASRLAAVSTPRLIKLATGIEPVTSSLPRMRSTN